MFRAVNAVVTRVVSHRNSAHIADERGGAGMTHLPLTIKDAARALRAGEITSVELTRTLIARDRKSVV